MKKTLLSMMTMAILASGSAYAVTTVEQEIIVEAEIAPLISLTKSSGTPLSQTNKLDYDIATNNGIHSLTLPIKIAVNDNTSKVNVRLVKEFTLEHVSNGKLFSDSKVFLDGRELSHVNDRIYNLAAFELNADLKISAKQPAGAVGGEQYSGIAHIMIESEI
ncbi:TPA: fimbrial assembly protein [Yersinia enterocolitica]|nr:fimbrial assembly protein [Yersinia enterocolitica]HEN3481448.1 fimbrial assembly protein [Yersinia enterocolitica]